MQNPSPWTRVEEVHYATAIRSRWLSLRRQQQHRNHRQRLWMLARKPTKLLIWINRRVLCCRSCKTLSPIRHIYRHPFMAGPIVTTWFTLRQVRDACEIIQSFASCSCCFFILFLFLSSFLVVVYSTVYYCFCFFVPPPSLYCVISIFKFCYTVHPWPRIDCPRDMTVDLDPGKRTVEVFIPQPDTNVDWTRYFCSFSQCYIESSIDWKTIYFSHVQ